MVPKVVVITHVELGNDDSGDESSFVTATTDGAAMKLTHSDLCAAIRRGWVVLARGKEGKVARVMLASQTEGSALVTDTGTNLISSLRSRVPVGGRLGARD